jgi:hypothetical protein
MTCYTESPAELNRIVPAFEIKPYVLGSDIFYKWMDDNGGMDKMRMIPGKAHKVLTMTYLNDARTVTDPLYDLVRNSGRTLECDLGCDLLRVRAYGRTI